MSAHVVADSNGVKPGFAADFTTADGTMVVWRCACGATLDLQILAFDPPEKTALHVALMINEMRLHKLGNTEIGG